MLSSTTTASDETNYNSSSSSWSSSQSLQASATTPPSRTMEEVWNDINLASLSDHHHNHSHNSPNFRNMALQDFLAQPFSNVVVSPSPDRHHHPTPPPPPSQTLIPSPPTVLSLNPLGDSDQFQLFCIENLNTTRPIVNINLPMSNATTVSADSSFGGASPFDALGTHHTSPSSGFVMPPAFGVENRRFPESGTGDRRHKRMIKNRESAARSRARKQAYTNELEIEVQHLMEENAKLRRQNEQLRNAAASPLPKKYNLQRSSTAPF